MLSRARRLAGAPEGSRPPDRRVRAMSSNPPSRRRLISGVDLEPGLSPRSAHGLLSRSIFASPASTICWFSSSSSTGESRSWCCSNERCPGRDRADHSLKQTDERSDGITWREIPEPKFWPETRIGCGSSSSRRRAPRKSGNEEEPKPVRSDPLQELLGDDWSVSTSLRSRTAISPSDCADRFHC